MATRMQQRRGTQAQWISTNSGNGPILSAGEIGYETDTNRFKIGDGTNHWINLDYFIDANSTVNPSFGTSIVFEGATADSYETTLQVTDPTADRTITLPNATGTIALTSDIAELSQDAINDALTAGTGITKTYNDAANTLTLAVDTTAIQARVTDVSDTEIGYLNGVTSSIQTQIDTKLASSTASTTYAPLASPTFTGTVNAADLTLSGNLTVNGTTTTVNSNAINVNNQIIFEGTTADAFETTLTVVDPTADRTITFPDTTGTVALTSDITTHGNLTEAHGATGAVVGTTNTQTLTNKTLTSPVINTPTGITKSDVGLANVDNTTDANKPVSTATQTALDLKAPLASPTFTGTVTLPSGTVTSTMILDGTIATADIADSAITSAKIANGTILNEDINASAAIALSKLATDPLARSNHTGSQTASTISDFNEAAQDAIGGILGTGLTYNDASNTITVDSTNIQLRVANVTDTEIGYLDGVTSGIQTQLNDKAPLASPTFTGTVTLPTGTVTSTMIANATIVDEDVSASAAIAQSKISGLTTDLAAKLALAGGTMTGAIAMGTNKITGLGDPIADQDAATKAYVDAATAGLNVHQSVKAATTVAIGTTYNNGTSGVGATIAPAGNGALSIDGVSLSVGNRILVKNQTSSLQNGVYVVTTVGGSSSTWLLTRASDYDTVPEVDAGDFIYVENGTSNGTTGWVQTATVTTLGTDSITFTQFSGAGTYLAGTGLTLTGSTFSINTGTTVDLNTAQTLTNKTINLTSNTLSGTTSQFNTALSDGDFATLAGSETLTNKTIALGSNTISGTLAQFNTAVTDADFASLAGSETLTNKTINGSNNTITNVSLTSGVTGTLPVANGGTGITSLGTGIATFLGTPSSANLASAITDETGSGALVFANTPTLVTPNIGAATGTSLTTTGGGLLARAASTQDGIEIRGRAGGTGNWEAILTPATLTSDQTLTIPNETGTLLSTAQFTAKGALLVGTGSGTFSVQSVGSNGQVLAANSAQADGVEWVTPAGGAAFSELMLIGA